MALLISLHVQLMEINRRVHKQNNVPKEFPLFVRNGYRIKVVADDYEVAPSGLMFKASHSSLEAAHNLSALDLGIACLKDFLPL